MTSPRDPFRFAPALCVAAMAWLALFPISSVDAYYHLAIGKRILEDRAIPERGVGSATFGSAPWHDNEWGFQLLAAAIAPTERDASGVLVLTQGGRVALISLRAATLAGTLLLLSGLMRRRGVDSLTRAAALVLVAFLTFGNLFWDVRPQILSYLGTAAILWLLERHREGAGWALPVSLGVVAVWANVHGAFILGVLLLGAEAAGDLAEGIRDPDARRRGLRLLAATAAAAVAACLNPLGWRQVAHPFLYVLRPEIHEANAEWTRPDLLHLPLLVLTVAAWIAATIAAGRPRLSDLAKVGLTLVLFSTAIRHLPIAAIVLVPALAAASAAAAERGGRRRIAAPFATGSTLSRAAAALLVVVAIVALSGAKFVGIVPAFEERTTRPMPERGARVVAEGRVAGAGFNAYRFGGFLMFRLWPEERVFMDGRNDLYGAFRNEVYTPILETAPGWREAWERERARYDVGWALLDEASPLARALTTAPGWLPPLHTDGPPGEGIVLVLADTEANRAVVAREGRGR